jgi:nicotinamidase-related amidase
MRALIIVDMLNDFVDGKLANPKAQAIIGPLQRLLEQARGPTGPSTSPGSTNS